MPVLADPPTVRLPWGEGDPPRASQAERDALMQAKNESHYWAKNATHDIPFRFVYRDELYRVRFRLFHRHRKPEFGDRYFRGHYVSVPGRFETADLAARAASFFLRTVYGPDWPHRPFTEMPCRIGRESALIRTYADGPAFMANGRLRPPAWADEAVDEPGRWQAKAFFGGTGRFRPVNSSARDGYYPTGDAALLAAKTWWLAAAVRMRLISGPCCKWR